MSEEKIEPIGIKQNEIQKCKICGTENTYSEKDICDFCLAVAEVKAEEKEKEKENE